MLAAWELGWWLLLGAVVPSFLMGRQQGASHERNWSGTLCCVILVTLVVFVTLDLDQPRRGLIKVNRESFDRLVESIAK